MDIENSNTEESKAASVWQVIGDKWNDQLPLPITMAL
jgi:hypothetical protein